MKIAIIEDESPICKTICNIINQYISNAEIIGTANNSKDAYNLLKNSKPEIALCDINIGEDTIFDVLDKLDSINFKLIFITAHEEYALKAIKLSAIDYLLKPVDPLELIEALKKANISIKTKYEQEIADTLVLNYQKPSKENQRIVLKTAESIFIISISDIQFIQADGSYSTFYLNDGRKILVSKLIKEYNEMLDEYGFIRVHQSSLVNLSAIDRYEKTEGGYLVMKDGHHVSVSIRKKDFLLKQLGAL